MKEEDEDIGGFDNDKTNEDAKKTYELDRL